MTATASDRHKIQGTLNIHTKSLTRSTVNGSTSWKARKVARNPIHRRRICGPNGSGAETACDRPPIRRNQVTICVGSCSRLPRPAICPDTEHTDTRTQLGVKVRAILVWATGSGGSGLVVDSERQDGRQLVSGRPKPCDRGSLMLRCRVAMARPSRTQPCRVLSASRPDFKAAALEEIDQLPNLVHQFQHKGIWNIDSTDG